ncbi:N-terminal nucleophile aminohydrolase [Parathielavia appendiculata]|uniref:Proteasome subunit beta n=1 Tax=Parathielavia appendiculata TaxID=2587402 RepID=A0AAN6U6L7_9PEZI|nr:N-terminal nucleophile aminohydrolase [Parathielavia appendiculata]
MGPAWQPGAQPGEPRRLSSKCAFMTACQTGSSEPRDRGRQKHPNPTQPPTSTNTYNAKMEVLLGITGKDFTLIAASKAAMRGATILKAADDKTRQLNKHTLMAFSGEAGDTVQFAEYIQANAQLYSMRNETDLSPSALAHFVRGELASSLRSRKPYNVNLLLGGVDPITHKPSLYWLDYLASLAPVPYAAHGYAQYYCLSILDKHHQPDIALERGMELLTLCADELKRRLPIDFKGLVVKAVTKDGIIDMPFDDDRIVKSA